MKKLSRKQKLNKAITRLRHTVKAVSELDSIDRQYILRWMRDTHCPADWSQIAHDHWRIA